MMTLDLNQLRREANDWLLQQPTDRALPPHAVAYFRAHFCLPWWLVEAIQRDEEKDARQDDGRGAQ